MLTRQAKIATEFRLTTTEVTALFTAGLDTPRAIKEAAPERLPEHLRDKLSRFHHAPKGAKALGAQAGDDLTKIKGVGNEIQGALYNAGFTTYADLRAASDEDLLAIPAIHNATLANIRTFLRAEDGA